MGISGALESGFVGAAVLTAVHETARQRLEDAPRMDILGKRAITRTSQELAGWKSEESTLDEVALLGDIVSNSLYYSLVGLGKPEGAWARGLALGIVAGVGAVVLPGPLGLGKAPSQRTMATQVMTVSWYVLGGLAAGVAYRILGDNREVA